MTIAKQIFVTFKKEGIHCYPAAKDDANLATGGWDDVSFLAAEHRHIFHFRVQIEIFHDDRCLEFIQVKRQCERWLGEDTLKVDHQSCEMMADNLYKLITEKWPERYVEIEVSEDGENGCIMKYPVQIDEENSLHYFNGAIRNKSGEEIK